MKAIRIFIWLMAIVLLAGCSTSSPNQQMPTVITQVFFKAHNIRVWSYLPIAESVGVETSEQGAFSVGGDGWVKYIDGPRVAVAGTNFLFNQEVVSVTFSNMTVSRTSYTMGARPIE